MREKIYSEILDYFPNNLKTYFKSVSEDVWELAKEIRIRVGRPLIINCFDKDYLLECLATSEDILRLVENFSENSLYSFQKEINAGFITIKGGHRIGISGTSIFENNKIKNITYISSLNIRIAREIKWCGKYLMDKICQENFENTLLISPPGCGKTTLLRDIIRVLSNGENNTKGINIGLVDERAEIAAMYKGVPQNDVGLRTDVMNNCEKYVGMKMMIRSMGPDVIATDEIGNKEDVETILEACTAGIKLLLTAHGNELKDVPSPLLENKVFNNIIILEKKNHPR